MREHTHDKPVTENWKPIPGYEGFYEVSDLGMVRSLDRKIRCGDGVTRVFYGQVLTPRPTVHGGHHQVNLSRGSRADKKNRYVHRLVMAAFVGPCPPDMEVCHNNGHPTDNRLSNLRYGTTADNRRDSVKHGTHWLVAKTHCPLGHDLVQPNLKPSEVKAGRRSCLACSRARARVRRHPEVKPHLKEIADSYFEDIMKTA